MIVVMESAAALMRRIVPVEKGWLRWDGRSTNA